MTGQSVVGRPTDLMAGLTVAERPRALPWVNWAVAQLVADDLHCPDTSVLPLVLSCLSHIDLYLKDESAHATGSLKHRLARSLVLYGLCNGWINEGTTLVEASSGSTAVSEAWFAQLLGLPFVAVLPRGTSPTKIALIADLGGRIEYVDSAGEVYEAAAQIARDCGGHYLDQFTYAERATDWRGNNNIAESLLDGLVGERYPVPTWIVASAGTGGTAATIGRYLRYRSLDTRLCLVDPDGSAYFDAWANQDPTLLTGGSSIEGIGRPRSEPSFLPGVFDLAVRVPDEASVAAMRWFTDSTGLCAGPSTGTNLIGALMLARRMDASGEAGSVVTLLCDRGDRYTSTYYDDSWVASRGWDLSPWRSWLDELQ